jgi:hypothetical protein
MNGAKKFIATIRRRLQRAAMLFHCRASHGGARKSLPGRSVSISEQNKKPGLAAGPFFAHYDSKCLPGHQNVE